jgi:hypothetical protein
MKSASFEISVGDFKKSKQILILVYVDVGNRIEKNDS